ncbi:MAG: DUF1724 domain-containing protein [Methanobrevibacter sp.]|nr:DUF1724 domain-containing protein [Methanobrevibacter sp.]
MKMYNHREINEDIRFLAQSEIRLKILSELYKRPNDVRGLVKKTEITYSSVSSNINKLEQNNYIRKVKRKYHINPMAKIYFKALMDFKKSIDIINDYDSFWNKHNINQLSIDSIKTITALKKAKLIETTPLDIYKTHNTTKKQLIESKDVKAIFPYLHPEYPALIETILQNGGSVELIVPKTIFKAILSPINDKIKKDAIRQSRLKTYLVNDELDLYLTICDKKMSLGLFKNDGSFDQNRILISDDEKSHEWAEELYKHVKHMVIK